MMYLTYLSLKKGVLIFVQILTHLLVGFCNTSSGVLNTSFGELKYTPMVCFPPKSVRLACPNFNTPLGVFSVKACFL